MGITNKILAYILVLLGIGLTGCPNHQETAKKEPPLPQDDTIKLIVGFVEQLAPDKAKTGIESAQNIIERRINALGLKEPRIQRYGNNQLQIQLPGVAVGEIKRIKEILATCGNLELKLQAEKSIRDVYTKPPDAPPGYSWPPPKPAKEGEHAPESVLVNDTPVLTGTHIVKATWSYSQHLGNIVEIQLNREGTAILADTSEKYSAEGGDARQLAIILDGKLYSAPVIQSKISDGKPIISNEHTPGGLPADEARDLAMILSSGSLPCPMEIKKEITNTKSIFKEAIRLKPDDAEAHYGLGLAYRMSGDYPKAIESYKQAIRLRPDYAEAHNNLGGAYHEMKNYQKAIESYKQAIRLKPDLADAHNNLGATYIGMGDYQKAIESYKEAIRLRPDYAEAHNNLGVAYLVIDKRGSALEEYKILKGLNEELANELFNLIYAEEK